MKNLMSNEEYFEESFHDFESSKNILEKASFEACSFEHCNFTSAKFICCKFIDCIFNNCNLSLMEIPTTCFHEVSFNECKLSGVDWTQAHWPEFNLY